MVTSLGEEGDGLVSQTLTQDDKGVLNELGGGGYNF